MLQPGPKASPHPKAIASRRRSAAKNLGRYCALQLQVLAETGRSPGLTNRGPTTLAPSMPYRQYDPHRRLARRPLPEPAIRQPRIRIPFATGNQRLINTCVTSLEEVQRSDLGLDVGERKAANRVSTHLYDVVTGYLTHCVGVKRALEFATIRKVPPFGTERGRDIGRRDRVTTVGY